MEEKKLYDEAGSLLLFSKATKKDIDLLLTLLSVDKYDYIDILRVIFKDDIKLIKFLDIMAGQKVHFLERRKVYKTLEKVVIYNYCKSRNFSEDSFKTMAKQYDKRIPQVKSIISTVDKFLASETNEGFNIEDISS